MKKTHQQQKMEKKKEKNNSIEEDLRTRVFKLSLRGKCENIYLFSAFT